MTLHPAICVKTFGKIDSFLKSEWNILGKIKGRVHLWRTASFTLYYFAGEHFSLLLWIPVGNRTKLKKLCKLKHRQRWRIRILLFALTVFLSAIAVMKVIFWIEDNFCFISDCKNWFKGKVQKLINKKNLQILGLW